MNYLRPTGLNLSLLHACFLLLSVYGLIEYKINVIDIIHIIIGYFIFSCLGFVIGLHRYYAHRSFTFKTELLKHFFTILSILSARGSPLGWSYIHRLHHKHSDTHQDPHQAKTIGLKILVPYMVNFGDTIHKRYITDLLTKKHIFINDYYVLFIITWTLLLSMINFKMMIFFYAIPIVLTHFAAAAFVLIPHQYGYRSFDTTDNSTNNWVLNLFLWGEGWHNNHHNDSSNYTTSLKPWELDIAGNIIRYLKT